MKSVAIVANGPSVFNDEWGEHIDRHDIVVRFSEGPFHIVGYEWNVGTRTDIWSVDVKIIWQNMEKAKRLLKTIKEVRCPVQGEPKKVQARVGYDPLKELQKAVNPLPCRPWKAEAIRRAHFSLGYDLYDCRPKPTTGYNAVFEYLYCTKGVSEISLFGFTGYQRGQAYFWDRNSRCGNAVDRAHNGPHEHKTLLRLAKMESSSYPSLIVH